MKVYLWEVLLTLPVVLALGCGGRGVADTSVAPASEEPHSLRVEVVETRPAQIRSTLELIGTLIPIRATTVASDIDGKIKSFPLSGRAVEYTRNGQEKSVHLGLDIGDSVKKGELVCQIDPVDYELALAAAQAKLELTKQKLRYLLSWKRSEEVAELRARAEEAAARHVRCQADLERSQQMMQRKVTSRSQHDEAVMAERMAAAELKQAEAALALAEAGPTKEEIAVAKAEVAAIEAEVNRQTEELNKTAIRAPYDAVVAERYLDVGDRVTGTPQVDIMQLIDPRILFAEVAVPEQYQRLVKLGDVATVRVADMAEGVPGVVDLINAKVDPDTRTFRVRVTIDNEKHVFKSGSFVSVDLPIASASGVLVVPEQAVVVSDGRPAVFVCREGRVERRFVRRGIGSREACEIISRLSAGEYVDVDTPAMLTDGMRVQATRIKPKATDKSGPGADRKK